MADINLARTLRKNLTDAEQCLWRRINRRQIDGAKFRRQQPIGQYIVDFVCFERQIILEIDGGHHALQHAKDEQRSRWLETQGFCILRFWNNEVLAETEAVVQAIYQLVIQRATSPHPSLPPQGGKVPR